MIELGSPPKSWHHFTVDVEEYFQVSAFESAVGREAWSGFESRVERGVSLLVDLLNAAHARATFFVLGWTAEQSPHVVRKIADAGHEIASHGWDHRRVSQQSREAFRASVRRSKEVLEQLTGHQVQGFRAPDFSIVRGSEWALDVLVEEGYAYDSSLFPVRRPGYGYPNGDRDPHWLQRTSGNLAEVPPATLRRFGLNIPAGGGAYFRLLPYGVVRAALQDFETRGVPATFYIHPWELDPGQPRLNVSWLTRWRHYGGLHNTVSRVQRLLREFRFRPIAETVEQL
jgi:polysaccharide deacetylase family protein (PEP-CTERM system associated)